jgi:hypothetical protein
MDTIINSKCKLKIQSLDKIKLTEVHYLQIMGIRVPKVLTITIMLTIIRSSDHLSIAQNNSNRLYQVQTLLYLVPIIIKIHSLRLEK